MSAVEQRPAQGYASIAHGHLFYERSGSGPAIVFVHAGIADRTMWSAQVAAFADSFEVITYDSRGYGLSLSDPVEFSPVEDLRELLDHLEIERAVLVGCSRGAIHCLDFAVSWPERAVGVVWVCGGVSGFDVAPSQDEEVFYAKMKEACDEGDWATAADLETRVWLDGAEADEGRVGQPVRGAVRERIRRVRSRPEDGIRLVPPARLAAENFDRLECPVLVMVGALDITSVRQAADFLSESL